RMKALNPAVYLAVARADYKRARTLGDEVLDVADRLKIRDAIWPAPSVVAAHLGLREFAAARQTLAAFEEMSVERVDVLRAQLHRCSPSAPATRSAWRSCSASSRARATRGSRGSTGSSSASRASAPPARSLRASARCSS